MNIARMMGNLFYLMGSRSTGSARQPYTGEQLRALRKARGVGRPPKVMQEATPAYWSRMLQAQHVNRGYLQWMARSALKAL